MGAESSAMTINWPFASAEQYALGNYVEIQKDGSPLKVLKENNEMLGERYSANSFVGRSLYNTLLAGRNAVLGCIGDSTSAVTDNWMIQLAEKIGDLGLAKVIYHTFDDTAETFNASASYGLSPTGVEENGISFNDGTNAFLTRPSDASWTSLDAKVEARFSNYQGVDSFLFAKWTAADADKSFYLRALGNNLLFTWWDGVAQQTAQFVNALLGVVATDTIHYKVEAEADRGDGNYEVKLYSTVNNGVTWVNDDTKTGTGTTVFNRTAVGDYDIGTFSSSSSFTSTIKIHKACIYNGIDGEMIMHPANIEDWGNKNGTDDVTYGGSIPVLNIYNGSIAGEAYSYWDATKIAETTVPDEYQSFIVNHGHNSQWDIGDVFYQQIVDFVALLNAQILNPTLMFSTQNPWTTGYTYESRKYTMPLKATMTRRFANTNSLGIVDTMTWINETVTDWESEMTDAIHPNATLYEREAIAWLNFITGR